MSHNVSARPGHAEKNAATRPVLGSCHSEVGSLRNCPRVGPFARAPIGMSLGRTSLADTKRESLAIVRADMPTW